MTSGEEGDVIWIQYKLAEIVGKKLRIWFLSPNFAAIINSNN